MDLRIYLRFKLINLSEFLTICLKALSWYNFIRYKIVHQRCIPPFYPAKWPKAAACLFRYYHLLLLCLLWLNY